METKKYSTLNQYILTKTLGSGFNCKVKLGLNNDDGKYYAVKIIRDTQHVDSNIKAVLNEAKILQKLDHPNIIKLIDVSDQGVYTKPDGRNKKVMYAVLQLAAGGEIFEYLVNTGRFSEPIARFYFKQLIESLDYCHSQGFAHRDIKPENILLDENFNLLLADFGFATMLAGKDGSGKLKSILGTESYMAPEIHSKAPYVGTSVDLFAAGIILFVYITGHPPFNEAKATDVYYNLICMNNHEKFWMAHSRRKPGGLKFFSPEFINLMNALLAFDPTQRPSMSEIKAHPWYNGPTATHEQVVQELSMRKMKVDKILKRKKMIEMRKKQAERTNNNVAFNPIQATFRNLIVEKESVLNAECKNDDKKTELLNMANKFEQPILKREEEETEYIHNAVHLSIMDKFELYKTAICIAFKKTTLVEAKEEKLKVKLTFMTKTASVGVKMKIKRGKFGSFIEFSRAHGPSLEYWKKVKELNKEFEIVENRIAENIEGDDAKNMDQ